MHLTKKSYIYISIILFIIIISGLIVFIRISTQESTKRITPKPTIVIGKIAVGEVQRSETLTGDILPIQQANIFSRVNGNIEKNFVDIGSRVSYNQILSLIDTTLYAQNARQSKANLLQAEASYKNSKLNYERNKKLLEQKLISQQDYDNAKAQYDVALAQKEAAEAVYNNASTQLGYCKIVSPFAGTITKRFFDPGSYVLTTNTQSSTLFVLMNLDRLKISVNVPERSVPYLQNVKDVLVTADAVPNKTFTAKISKISQSIDLSSRTMPIEIELNNTGNMLKPGMFATVKFITENKSNANIIPNNVVQNDEKGDYIFIVNQDTTVSKKYIKIGIKMDEQYEILSGVGTNDKIVFAGQTLIKDKMKVKIAK
jgi:membrane fusion protein, multidrug efflux system